METTNNEPFCDYCMDTGYTIEVEAECCGNYKEYGCCGIPIPAQVQVQCKCKELNRNTEIK